MLLMRMGLTLSLRWLSSFEWILDLQACYSHAALHVFGKQHFGAGLGGLQHGIDFFPWHVEFFLQTDATSLRTCTLITPRRLFGWPGVDQNENQPAGDHEIDAAARAALWCRASC